MLMGKEYTKCAIIAPQTMKHLVFVYCTLKESFPNFANDYGRRLPGLFTSVGRYQFCCAGENGLT